MKLGIDGSPPKWATCPICVKSLECTKCEGAQLQGTATDFAPGPTVTYRCPAGHQRAITVSAGDLQPESAQCPDCDGMLMPVSPQAEATA
jgi:hypothetical protein